MLQYDSPVWKDFFICLHVQPISGDHFFLLSSMCEVSSCDVKPMELEADYTCIYSGGLECIEFDHLTLYRLQLPVLECLQCQGF